MSRGIGIVGVGGIAQHHLDAYRSREFRIVAGHDASPAALEKVRAGYGEAKLTTDLGEFLATPGLDVVDLAVPHYAELRRPIIEAVARSGKALFCQKPLDETYAGAAELTRIALDAGIPFAVNQNAPFVPGFAAAKAVLRSADGVGAPFWFQIENRGSLWFDAHPHWGSRDRWILAGMAVHHLALVHDWFGPPSRVSATLARDPRRPDIRAENIAVVALEYASGLKGLIINNWSYAGPKSRPHPAEEIIVIGAAGTLTLDSKEMTLCRSGTEPIVTRTQGEWFNDAFGESMRAFLGQLDGGPAHPSAGDNDLAVMAVVEAAYRSAAEGRGVAPSEITGKTN